ncbi:hypothetical protein BD626DRAFT_497017 [Schizophyllum amplum]|uniref:Uncharacterized protein n=1 Tax=Schizophyllum amplum TaxID=97359 RepID=A0A550CDS2_9AGAR|nr:hypothetical protein BD626DRAFT_497017 [Auriculariopsis ampla]
MSCPLPDVMLRRPSKPPIHQLCLQRAHRRRGYRLRDRHAGDRGAWERLSTVDRRRIQAMYNIARPGSQASKNSFCHQIGGLHGHIGAREQWQR